MRKLTFVFISFFITFSFYGQVIRTTPELNAVFTISEIKDINTLVNYFEEIIFVEGKEIEECYKNWFWSIQNGGFESEYKLDVFNYENQVSVYGKISNSTFNNIWSFGSTYSEELKDKIKVIGPNDDGKYLKYLELIGVERAEIKEYVESVIWAWEYGMISALPVFLERNKLNDSWVFRNGFQDFNDKVILVIMTLTTVDEYGRKELFKNN